MISVFNQFRRLYDDVGNGDHDFTGQEMKLKAARDRLMNAASELIHSSELLNAAALSSLPVTKH
jgi:hypothetical protein